MAPAEIISLLQRAIPAPPGNGSRLTEPRLTALTGTLRHTQAEVSETGEVPGSIFEGGRLLHATSRKTAWPAHNCTAVVAYAPMEAEPGNWAIGTAWNNLQGLTPS